MVFAWTCLLIWADRKPAERKGVLLLTIFPVLVGILTTRLYKPDTDPQFTALYNSFTIGLVILALFFIYSYFINFINQNTVTYSHHLRGGGFLGGTD